MKYLVEVNDDLYLIDVESSLSLNSYCYAQKIQHKKFEVIGKLVSKKSLYFYKTSLQDVAMKKEIKLFAGETKFIFKYGKNTKEYTFNIHYQHHKKQIGPFSGYVVFPENTTYINTSKVIVASDYSISPSWKDPLSVIIVEKENIDKLGFLENLTPENFEKFQISLDKKIKRHIPKIQKLLEKKKLELIDNYIIQLQDISNRVEDSFDSGIIIDKNSMRYQLSI